jgi:hypothetical protein
MMLYIPAGFAHGFQTLADDTIVECLMGVGYEAELSDGFRHDDPLIVLGGRNRSRYCRRKMLPGRACLSASYGERRGSLDARRN